MAKAKFSKGQEVYRFASWDDKGTFSVRKYVVNSCGARQMHLRRVDDGSNAEFRAYAPFTGFELVSDVADPTARALEYAAAYIARMKAYWEAKLTGSDGSTAWSDSEAGRKIARKQIALFTAAKPAVVER